MSVAITAILAMIEQFLPLIGTAVGPGTVGSVITTLGQILPLVDEGATAIIPAVKNIIAALSANPAATASQIAELQALDKQADDLFDAAMTDFDAG